MSFASLFPQGKPFIAVIHLGALPGAPLYQGSMDAVYEQAIHEAKIFSEAGADAIILENFRDTPFYPDRVPHETVAAMAAIGREVVRTATVPIGVNVLRNDAAAAIAIAAAIQAQFIRVNVHIAASVTDQGLIQAKAWETLRLRKQLNSNAYVLADVAVKHAAPLAELGLDVETRDLTYRGMCDGIIVSGSGTGQSTNPEDLKVVKANSHLPILIGSGVTHENLVDLYPLADGFIVGSCLKTDGKATNAVDAERVSAFAATLNSLRN